MIVMGRAADVVLTGQHIPHISIYITAPFAIRVRRMMELKNLDLKQAINLVRKMDHKHQDYYHSFTVSAGVMRSIMICVSTVHATELMSR